MFPLSLVHSAPANTLDDNLRNMLGVWNRVVLDTHTRRPLLDFPPDDGINYRVLVSNGKEYAGDSNSVEIRKTNNNEYIIVFMGTDTIVDAYFAGEQLILEVMSEYTGSGNKIGITFIPKEITSNTEDIIYFTLLEGDTSAAIDYGQRTPYIRARLLSDSASIAPNNPQAQQAIEEAEVVVVSIIELQDTALMASDTPTNPMPFWALIAIISGAIVVAGATALLIAKKVKATC